MSDLCLLNVITNRDSGETFFDFLRENGVETAHSLPCRGTAGKKLLSFLGLEATDKTLLYVMTTRKRAKRLLSGMVSELGLDMPGCGITFVVPVGSVAGASSLKYLTESQNIILGEVSDMPAAFLYELIVAIANRGHADNVMDAAREAGARGGTIIHAKGTNPHNENQFFGVSIAKEKEMILILTAAADKSRIMRAVMDKAGISSPAHTVMFSLPVESVAGLKSVMQAAGEVAE